MRPGFLSPPAPQTRVPTTFQGCGAPSASKHAPNAGGKTQHYLHVTCRPLAQDGTITQTWPLCPLPLVLKNTVLVTQVSSLKAGCLS